MRGRLFDISEESSAALRIPCEPGPLINVGSAQSLRLCFEYPLPMPKPGLKRHRAAHVPVVGYIRLGAFNVSVCFIELASVGKKPCQGAMDPKQVVVPVVRGRDAEGCLEMIDRLPCLPLEWHISSRIR